MDAPKVYRILFSDLYDFVRNKAQPGDIVTCNHPSTKHTYIYYCTHDNIGENANPYWIVVDEKAYWRKYFEKMTLEDKVNFLIENFIQNNT